MNNSGWLEELETLLVCFSHLGMDADIATLSIIEAWGLYCFLSRLSDG